MKNYRIKHSVFFEILAAQHGKANLAFLVHTICFLLKKIADVDGMHGNLRAENVILTLDQANTTIKKVRFLGFDCMTMIEDAEDMQIPDQIDHLPPDMISYFLKM